MVWSSCRSARAPQRLLLPHSTSLPYAKFVIQNFRIIDQSFNLQFMTHHLQLKIEWSINQWHGSRLKDDSQITIKLKSSRKLLTKTKASEFRISKIEFTETSPNSAQCIMKRMDVRKRGSKPFNWSGLSAFIMDSGHRYSIHKRLQPSLNPRRSGI